MPVTTSSEGEQSWELGTQSGLAMKGESTLAVESLLIAPWAMQWQVKVEVEAGLKPRHYNVGCGPDVSNTCADMYISRQPSQAVFESHAFTVVLSLTYFCYVFNQVTCKTILDIHLTHFPNI